MASHPKGWTKAKAAKAHRPRRVRTAAESLGDYTVRTGTDGKTGIYLRAYNVRIATFNAGTEGCQRALQRVFDLVESGQLSC